MHFLEVRRNLRTLFDAIAWIDWNIFTETVKGLIVMTLQSGNENLQNLQWMDAEVALYVLYILGEAAAKGTSILLFSPVFRQNSCSDMILSQKKQR